MTTKTARKELEANDGSAEGSVLGIFDLMSHAGPFVVITKSISGREIYFTGADESCYVTSPYASLAQRFATYAEASNAIARWNRLGHKFYCRPATEAECAT